MSNFGTMGYGPHPCVHLRYWRYAAERHGIWGGYFEKNISTNVTTPYHGGVALRLDNGLTQSVYYALRDHLGSTAITLDSAGTLYSELRYKAFGEEPYSTTTPTPTSRQFTGQRKEGSIGLYYYVARWYDPALGRFVQDNGGVFRPRKG